MGICGCKTQKKNVQAKQGSLPKQMQQQQSVSLIQQNQQITETAQAGNKVEFREQDLQKEPAKVQETQAINQNPEIQQFNDEIFVNDIMKSFDELNQLFNQMAQEFDSISQYLQSMSGYQE
ncbi:unnamed protein product (macronuclear) [Paramecium tetraurelia]|uniref:Uncharacterized protein n=1 Tax=Paramecium tetraurelia TaxID=5888 RepID=A0D7A9_PARTE|nr:uncharacterized protein GSPATT00001968001 [Paramecium tetraurelia]CAK78926.1 unnamed protein product [Paramecium tetraurelia]|eukprot:XP_001446323.1 hypothetical protein (macronuclear) [Paramecium tetraurelia strain d4-2]